MATLALAFPMDLHQQHEHSNVWPFKLNSQEALHEYGHQNNGPVQSPPPYYDLKNHQYFQGPSGEPYDYLHHGVAGVSINRG